MLGVAGSQVVRAVTASGMVRKGQVFTLLQSLIQTSKKIFGLAMFSEIVLTIWPLYFLKGLCSHLDLLKLFYCKYSQ